MNVNWKDRERKKRSYLEYIFGTYANIHIRTVLIPGHYLYIEASGRLVNDTARIVSPLYNSSLTDSGCFSFW